MQWILFYGVHEFGMTPNQVLRSKRGVMLDLIACLAVYNGTADEKKKLSFDEVMRLK